MTAGNKAGSEATTGGASTEKRVEKVADAFVLAFVVTVQLLAMPLHAPPQPAKPQVARRSPAARPARYAVRIRRPGAALGPGLP